ncbi:DUF6083 domain-containing protein [Streptomyces sp. NPDC058664]|uniref:DUF6083 domain-containing protein n=1 Tax=unclassified Streptomyces TaxID=2593676 RepID=UPI003663651F
MGQGRRSDVCDSCGAPYATWVASLGTALCPGCEGTGAGRSTRDPVLVGDVLAGLAGLVARDGRVDTVALADRTGRLVPDRRLGHGVPDQGSGHGVPDQRSGHGVPDQRSGHLVPEDVAPGGAVCGRCGASARWHRTVRGRWVLIEPGELTTRAVPAGSRWRVAGDGTAVGLGSAVPSGTCRVSHFDVCAANPEPVGSPVLLALWRGHARRFAVHGDPRA